MSDDKNERKSTTSLSRRDLFRAGVALGVGAALPSPGAHAAPHAGSPDAVASSAPPLVFVNGKIHTMDDANRVVNSVTIRDGRFVEVTKNSHGGHDATVIDLGGRTVVPGLIESHTHFVSLANRPGYHVAQWELASNVAEVLALLAARRKGVPERPVHHGHGRRHPADVRRIAPADARRARRGRARPAGVSLSGRRRPARTNTLGKQFFESATAPLAGPCVVGADGSLVSVGGVNHANRALYHLRIRQTFEDKKRSALDAMAFSASVGITAVLDQTLVAVATGTLDPASLDPQPTHALFNLNLYGRTGEWDEARDRLARPPRPESTRARRRRARVGRGRGSALSAPSPRRPGASG